MNGTIEAFIVQQINRRAVGLRFLKVTPVQMALPSPAPEPPRGPRFCAVAALVWATAGEDDATAPPSARSSP